MIDLGGWPIQIDEAEISLMNAKEKVPAERNKSILWRLLRENLKAQRVYYIVAAVAMALVAGTTAGIAWIMRDQLVSRS